MFKTFFSSGVLLLEDLNRNATWNSVGPKLIERLKAQDPATGHYDTHPIATGLRIPHDHPEDADIHADAKEQFLDKIEGMSPIGHAKTYGPMIGRIFAHGNHAFGEDDEGIRNTVQQYHELKSAGLFERGLRAGTMPAKYNNPSALNKLDDLHEIMAHPEVEAHFSARAQNTQLVNNHHVHWQGNDIHGKPVTVYAPHTVESIRSIYGVGKNGLKPEFGGAGPGWCTVGAATFENYTKIGSRNSDTPLLVFKRDHEDHPFLQVHAITGQVHGRLPEGPEAAPIKTQKARMANTRVPPSDVDHYLPGINISGMLGDTERERLNRAARGNARNHALGAIRRSTDEELVAHAAHEDPEFRKTAVNEAGIRGLQGILHTAVDDPDRGVVHEAVKMTSDPQVHRRFARPGAHPLDKIALAQNHHLSAENAIKLFNNSKYGTARATGWERRPDQINDDQWGSVSEASLVTRHLLDRQVPKRTNNPEEQAQYWGRRQNIFRRSPQYQQVLSHIGESMLDNASPHTAGLRDHTTGRQPGQRSIEEMVHAGETTEASDHVNRIIHQIATRSLDERLVNRVEKLPGISNANTVINDQTDTLRKVAQRGYRTKYYLDHPNGIVQAAAVIGTHPVIEGRKMRENVEQFDGGTVWRKNEKGKAAMFKPELLNVARTTDQQSSLINMLPYTKKWRDLKGVLAARVHEFALRSGQPNMARELRAGAMSEHAGSQLAIPLINMHKEDKDFVDQFASNPNSEIRERVANYGSDPVLHRLAEDPVQRIRDVIGFRARSLGKWDLAHKIVQGHESGERPVSRNIHQNIVSHAHYQDWLANRNNQQNESLRVKNFIKMKLLENVRV